MSRENVRWTAVWDPVVRILHWSLLMGFFAAYFTRNLAGAWHEVTGYGVLAIVLLRLIWGFVGSSHARFSQFLKSPAAVFAYARLVARGGQTRYLGHNPLGGWMIVAMLGAILITCLSGWLYTTDRFWGLEWVEELHDAFTRLTLGLVALHVLGVVFTSLHERENLIAAMFTGKKRNGRPAV